MFTEWFDLKRPAWDPQTLAALAQRLQESGYQGLIADYRSLLLRSAPAQGERIAAALFGAEEFVDVLIPPAQPRARIILHRREPGLLRVVVAARGQHEARLVGRALRLHLETALGGRLTEQTVADQTRALLARFRKDVLPSLRLTDNGARAAEVRSALAAQVLRALARQPVVRGRPTVLASQAATLAPDRPAEQVREALEQLVGDGYAERWHVVVCREKGAWLGSSPSVDEMRTFAALAIECPACGRRVRDEQADVAYRLGERAPAERDTRWLCDLVEQALRRRGADSVAVHHGGDRDVDGAACYQGAVILFRVKDDPVDIGDLMRLQEEGRRLESDGWRVFPLLVAERPLGLDTSGTGVTVIEGVDSLEPALEQLLKAAGQASLASLLPKAVRPGGVPLADLLPAD